MSEDPIVDQRDPIVDPRNDDARWDDPAPFEAAMPLKMIPGNPWRVEDQTGVVLGTVELVNLANRLWREAAGRA